MHLEDEFGDIIQKARQGKGLSVAEMAKSVNLSKEKWVQMENYSYKPDKEELQKIAQTLNLAPLALEDILNHRYQPRAAPVRFPWGSITQITAPGTGSHCYVLNQGDESIIIDSGARAQDILPYIQGKLAAILLTHTHYDHIFGLDDIKEQLYGTIILGAGENYPCSPCERIADRTAYPWGNISIQIIPSPGHTPGSLAFYVPGALFSGDTIFAGSLGRAQGPTNYGNILKSSRHLLSFPAQTGLFPGHGPTSSIQEEKISNPFIA